MNLTPILWLEIGVAILLGIAVLWAKAEYGVFLYAFALGFPDFAFPLGTTVNLRVEDVLIVLFLARAILWTPVSSSQSQKKIFTWLALFLAVCLFSAVVESAQGTLPSVFVAARIAGCAVIFGVLPLLMQSKRRLRFFVTGLMCAGIALTIQVRQHLAANAAAGAANFQQLKSAATFDTWNPNTIGQAAILLVFAAGLGWIIFSESPTGRIFWPCLAMGFALVPAFVVVRGSSMSIAAGFLLFLCLLRRWKSVLVFSTVCLCAILYLNSYHSQMLEDASTLDVTTGEGFSQRFDRWEMAARAIQDKPIVGHGFGQELDYLTRIGSEGVAHNDSLTVWLELGLGGILLFLVMIFQFVRAGWVLYGTQKFQRHGALILALMLALCLDGLGLPTLYWEKLPTIALSVAAAVVGICERDDLENLAQEVRRSASAMLVQHS